MTLALSSPHPEGAAKPTIPHLRRAPFCKGRATESGKTQKRRNAAQPIHSQLLRKDLPLAADYEELTVNLRRFYDFTGKLVIYVGVGGRQLLDPSVNAKKLVAIDRNVEALGGLRRNIAAEGAQDSAHLVRAKFEDVTLPGDVVYFEFCLHETADPQKALAHARALAPDVVVFDHLVGSNWAYFGAEDEKVRRSTEAMKRFGIRRSQTLQTAQRFKDYGELLANVAEQGPVSLQRVQLFAGSSNIVIPMPCELALL
jgi:hypothetical protein